MPILLFCMAVLAVLGLYLAHRLRDARRADYIRGYSFPKGLIEKLQQRHGGMATKDAQLVARALRQFFLAHLRSGRRFVSMPSQVTDDLWHEFILYTRHYDAFCKRAFGRFMHHTPAVVLTADRQNNTGLRRTWWWCCKEENINPRTPTRLPLLFALDAKLGIAGGFIYAADCSGLRREAEAAGNGGAVHCGGDFGSGHGDGSFDGFGDGTSEGGDGGGGDGGCGGGCGGGD